MTKKIYLEPAWKMHSLHQGLIDHPPPGYEFITAPSSEERIFMTASKVNFSYSLQHKIDKIVPLNLSKAYLERFRKIPQDADLTYSHSHLVFRKEPWVLDLELVSLLVGFSVKHFKRYRKVVQKALASEYCKKVLCETEAGKKSVLLNLDCTEFEHKLETLPLAAPKRNFTKNFDRDKIRLLFVSSANILGEFEIKGGREALAAFALLNKKYDNLELVIRSDVPQDVKGKYLDRANIRIIEERMPWEQLEEEFKSADIFILPAHNTPFLVFLDAMSYELPIVTIDAWANPEIVEDGKTGFLVRKSERIPYYIENFTPNFGSPQFQKAIRTPDAEVVQGLVEKTSILIENEELRRTMGKAARWEVEQGKFSIERRNEKLKRIFDEATA
jgi:glycosyltransferase involved in cell wall biosynthesis